MTQIKSAMRPVHVGEVLREEFLLPLNLSAHALAVQLGVTPARINEIVRERRGVTADTALRLAKFFDTRPEFWLNLQSQYELRTAEIASEQSHALDAITPYAMA